MSQGFPVEEVVDDARPESIEARPQVEDTEMDITPMIDITFLLLIFFIVASKMDESASVPLPPAKRAGAVATKECVYITVGPGEAEGPAKVYKGDGADPAQEIDNSDLSTLESDITAYVEEEVGKDQNKSVVLIMGAKGVKHKDISRTAKAAARVAEVQRMAVGVMEVQ